MNRNKVSGNIAKEKEKGKQMISVGIDVSKGKSTVCFLKPGGEVVKTPYEVIHNQVEFAALIEYIKSFNEEVRVVLENTGHYHFPVVKILVDSGIFVSTINALRMKKYCSQNIRKAKNDRIDAIQIASYGITYWSELLPSSPLDTIYKELQMLARQYHRTTSLLVKAKVDLSTILDQVMPGIQDLLQNVRESRKLTNFVAKYVHFENICSMGEKRFISNYCSWAKKQGYRGLHERKAKEIFTLAQNGIPVLPNTNSTKIVVEEIIRVLHEIESSRVSILAQMNTLAKTLPEFSLVNSFPCVGEVLTPMIISEIGDVRRFKNKYSLIAYAGIDSPPYQSGTFNATERHISKRGNSYLRKVGFEIMQSLIKHRATGDPVYEFIQKKRSEGKSYKEAMIAGLNKFLRIYYGKVKEILT